jgi:hypothetical protein
MPNPISSSSRAQSINPPPDEGRNQCRGSGSESSGHVASPASSTSLASRESCDEAFMDAVNSCGGFVGTVAGTVLSLSNPVTGTQALVAGFALGSAIGATGVTCIQQTAKAHDVCTE